MSGEGSPAALQKVRSSARTPALVRRQEPASLFPCPP